MTGFLFVWLFFFFSSSLSLIAMTILLSNEHQCWNLEEILVVRLGAFLVKPEDIAFLPFVCVSKWKENETIK